MMFRMRTTLTLDDDVAQALKKTAYEKGLSFKQTVNDTLRAGLAAGEGPRGGKPFRLRVSSLGAVRPGVDLDRALGLADAIEDGEIKRKLAQRK